MDAHNFSFAGGEILRGMGASWFVSYTYYEKIDITHRNWDRVSTTQSRISKYNKGKLYHKDWLKEVIAMNPVNLNKNSIGLSAEQTKSMTKELLEKW